MGTPSVVISEKSTSFFRDILERFEITISAMPPINSPR